MVGEVEGRGGRIDVPRGGKVGGDWLDGEDTSGASAVDVVVTVAP